MRHPWRLLLCRSGLRSHLHVSGNSFHLHSQTVPKSLNPLRSMSSLFQTTSFTTVSFPKPTGSMICNFSSQPELDDKKEILIDIFSKFTDGDVIRKELETNNVIISREEVLKVLLDLESNPDVARRFFNWVLENDEGRLCSKGYNLMLRILGLNGFVKEFWVLVDFMKRKGYGMSKGVHDKVLEKFKSEGLKDDVEKLITVFDSGSTDTSEEKMCTRICRIIKKEVWGDDVEQKIKDINMNFSSNSVKAMLEKLGPQPMKALIFFRWLEESGSFKHDDLTYNAMARVLGREDCVDRFWKVADEMRNAGYEMEKDTYRKVSESFYKRNMVKDAVDLYEFAMAGENEPSADSCTFLLRKIVGGKSLDMGLYSRVLNAYKAKGHVLRFSMLDTVLKALVSVGRFAECDKVLEAMKDIGFVADGNGASRVAYRLSSSCKLGGANEFMDILEASGSISDRRTLESLVEGHCVAGNLEKATECFRKMIESVGIDSVSYVFEDLIGAYCRKNRATDAFNLLCGLVNEKGLEPRHTTYKLMISKLLVQGGFKNALNLLGFMKNHGFPPFVDPFIEYVSKSGTADDAVAFLKAMSSKRFPSTSVVLRLFEAFFKNNRHDDAQDFLSKCPPFIRNHADVLNLFCSMKSGVAPSSSLSA